MTVDTYLSARILKKQCASSHSDAVDHGPDQEKIIYITVTHGFFECDEAGKGE